MSCTADLQPAVPPQDDLPTPTLKDFPALALHAVVIAVRRPASLLLPATATLFCARCVARVAEIALRLAESEHLNAWAGGCTPQIARVRMSRILLASLIRKSLMILNWHQGFCLKCLTLPGF